MSTRQEALALGMIVAVFMGGTALGFSLRTPCADSVEIVNVSGEREFSIKVPKGSRTLRGYLVSEGEKKRLNVTVKVDGNSGSLEWKE